MESMDDDDNNNNNNHHQSPKTDDDDRQTDANDQNSSDNLSSVSSETLLPASENNQRETSHISPTRVRTVNVANRPSLPNLNIKHPNQVDDDKDPFNEEEKRIIVDEHVTVSHVNRATLGSFANDILQLRAKRYSSGRKIEHVTVSRGNPRVSQSTNGNLNNRQTSQITARQRSTVHVSRISTAASINQGCKQKVIGSKPIVTRISLDNELTSRKTTRDMTHVSVRHTSGYSKKSAS